MVHSSAAPVPIDTQVTLTFARAAVALGTLAGPLSLIGSRERIEDHLTSAGLAPMPAAVLAAVLATLGELAERTRPEIGHERLTPREQEVLVLLAFGHSDRAIADRLAISPNTASTHVKRVCHKLGGGGREAVVACLWMGPDRLLSGAAQAGTGMVPTHRR